jgi:hypothetical protein
VHQLTTDYKNKNLLSIPVSYFQDQQTTPYRPHLPSNSPMSPSTVETTLTATGGNATSSLPSITSIQNSNKDNIVSSDTAPPHQLEGLRADGEGISMSGVYVSVSLNLDL